MPRLLRLFALLPLAALLGGCNFVVLDPAGSIAMQQRDLVLVATVLMLVIIIPVMALTIFFAWRYRASNSAARYEPEWAHSTHLELVIWAAPLAIIVCLGAVTWTGTHLLDPYRPLASASSSSSATPAAAEAVEPLEVEVVALDWKWLFIYPQYNVASVNELAAPVGRPISFRITASSVMNSFFIPALAGQIYAMPGMETKLHAVLDKPGTYEGLSANYSGAGFSGMHFSFKGLDDVGFDEWIDSLGKAGSSLGRASYLELEKPSENVPVQHYSSVDPELYDAVLNMCVERGKMCMGEMMMIDAEGGLGVAGIRNLLPALEYDKYARRGTVLGPQPSYVAAICSPAASDAPPSALPAPLLAQSTPFVGEGLALPQSGPVIPELRVSWIPGGPDEDNRT